MSQPGGQLERERPKTIYTLVENGKTSPLGCGCLVELSWEKRTVGAINVTFCPLHAQAPAMREALETLMYNFKALDEDYDTRACYKAARALLRAIEGA